MTAWFTIPITLLLFLLATFTFSQTQNDKDDITLEKIFAAVEKGSGGVDRYEYVVTTETDSGGKKAMSEYRIKRSGSKIRIDHEKPMKMSMVFKDSILSIKGPDGKVKKQKANKEMLDQMKGMEFGKGISDMRKNYDLKLDVKSSQPEKNLWVVAITPKKKGVLPPMVWTVDTAKGLVVKTKLLGESADQTVEIVVEDAMQKDGKWIPTRTKTISKRGGQESVIIMRTKVVTCNQDIAEVEFEISQ